MEEIKTVIYVTDDGKEFKDGVEAAKHEAATKIYDILFSDEDYDHHEYDASQAAEVIVKNSFKIYNIMEHLMHQEDLYGKNK
jgi:hypothetical protein